MPLSKELEPIVLADIDGLRRAEAQYGSSWKQRGGVGAFMMLARKWDRILRRISQPTQHVEFPVPDDLREQGVTDVRPMVQWDLVMHAYTDRRAEGIIDDIRDLRRYLLLVLSHRLSPQDHMKQLDWAAREAALNASHDTFSLRGTLFLSMRVIHRWDKMEAAAKAANWDVFVIDDTEIWSLASSLYLVEAAIRTMVKHDEVKKD